MTANFESFKEWLESDGSIPFDMYAQDPSDWSWLQELIPGFIVSSAGGAVPFQAEGLFQGYPFYYRDRGGVASLRVGELDGDPPYQGNSILYTASRETPEFEGSKHFISNLTKLIPLLDRALYLYDFIGKKLIYASTQDWSYTVSPTETEVTSSWGMTPEEAYLELMAPSRYLIEHGASAELQERMCLDRAFNPIPLNVDDRHFPASMPNFHIAL